MARKQTWRETAPFRAFAKTLTDEQAVYVEAILSSQLTIVNARSGTGKTTLAVATAKFLGKPLLYVFNPTEENRMGYRPGDQAEKEAAYLRPLVDAIATIGDVPDQAMSANGWVEATSHTFMRGSNIERRTVVIDEAQNFGIADLKKTLTRIHDDCRVIVIGHTGQIDLTKPSQSGFERMIDHFAGRDYVSICELTKNFRGRLANDADDM